jgi:hypothetical protein
LANKQLKKTNMTDNAKKWIWVSVGAITLGTGGFFLFKAIKNRINRSGQNNDSDSPNATNTGANTSYSRRNSTGSTANPFKTKAEVLAFQQWVINTKGDKKILGGGGTSGFGDDGDWGTNTASAWAKYGNDYKTSSQGAGSSANTWSATDGASLDELNDRLDYDYNQDTEEVSYGDGKEDFYWFPAGKDATNGYVRVTFKEGGSMIIEKRKYNSYYSVESYGAKNGEWKKTSTGWDFSLGGKNYPSQYSGQFIVTSLFTLMKDAGFYSWTDSSFVPFLNESSINNDWQKSLL